MWRRFGGSESISEKKRKQRMKTTPAVKAKANAPETSLVKIRFLSATSCETAEGQQLKCKAGEEREVPARAAEYLIKVGKAEAV